MPGDVATIDNFGGPLTGAPEFCVATRGMATVTFGMTGGAVFIAAFCGRASVRSIAGSSLP